MVLRSGAGATLQPGKKGAVLPLRDMDLLRPGYVLKAGKEPVRLVILEDGHNESIFPGKTVTVGKKGCDPADARKRSDPRITKTNRKQLHKFLEGQRAGLVVGRDSVLGPEIGWPISGSVTLSERPTFRWRAVKGAVKYEVRLETVKGKDTQLLWTTTTKDVTLPYPRGKDALQRGQTIHWSVTADTGGGKTRKVVEASELTVASLCLKKELAELAPLLESKSADDWLLAAVVSEGQRCYEEALPLYEKLAEKRPRQPGILKSLGVFYAHSIQKDKADDVRKRLKQIEEEAK
jgi:hypothetical protein